MNWFKNLIFCRKGECVCVCCKKTIVINRSRQHSKRIVKEVDLPKSFIDLEKTIDWQDRKAALAFVEALEDYSRAVSRAGYWLNVSLYVLERPGVYAELHSWNMVNCVTKEYLPPVNRPAFLEAPKDVVDANETSTVL